MHILQFSGGIDSLACLELLKGMPKLKVLTVSTDGAYPERAEYLAKVAEAYPQFEFTTIHTDRALEQTGYPVDVVPIKFTRLGNITQGTPVRYQSYLECCWRSIWLPMMDACKQLGATDIYRGQRADDVHKAPIEDGHVEDGITYHFPIEKWTRDDVHAYVKKHCPSLVPEYYASEKTSRDCWDCTAYLADNLGRIGNLSTSQHASVVKVLDQWSTDIANETRW